MEEVKKEQANVRSFRITDDVMIRFKEIQESITRKDGKSISQDSVLRMLVSSYELEQSKNAIPDRETEISNFQMKANELVEAFLYSLQLNQDAEARIKENVSIQIKSKNQTILDLQEKIKFQESIIESAKTAAIDFENKQKEAEHTAKEALKRMTFAEKTVKDKESIIEMLTGKLIETGKKLEEYPNLKISENKLKAQLTEANQQIKDIKREALIEQERAVTAIQKEMEILTVETNKSIANLESEKKHARTIAELNIEKALSALEKEKNIEKQILLDKIDILKDDKIELKDQISELKAQLARN